MALSQEGSSQKNRRTCRRILTGIPSQGRSASVLVYLECTRPENLPHTGHSALGSVVVAASVRRSASAEIQIRRSELGSGRMVWFGMADLGEQLEHGFIGQHAASSHRKLGRTALLASFAIPGRGWLQPLVI